MSERKQRTSGLPDTGKWLPRKLVRQNLVRAFLKRCKDIEQSILQRARSEREMNINNFDSGHGLEDIVREELSELFPSRYSLHAGVINDSKGYTADDCDIVITNDTWFTPIKPGATKNSRRFHFPIEAVYAVIEVKQTLNFETLDEAIGKLVKCHRLYRPRISRKRFTENLQINSSDVPDIEINTLYSGIIATGVKPGINKDDIIQRFFEINETLKPAERVRSLCILNDRTVGWRFPEPGNPNRMQHFVHEVNENLMSIAYVLEKAQCALYPFVCELYSHLFNSVLGPESYYEDYGFKEIQVKVLDFSSDKEAKE